MKEYIERKAVLNAMSKAQSDRTWSMDDSDVMEQMFDNVETVPAADVAPVVHGEWEVYTEYCNFGLYQVGWRCSLCGRTENYKQPYCNCGAKMDGGNSNEL